MIGVQIRRTIIRDLFYVGAPVNSRNILSDALNVVFFNWQKCKEIVRFGRFEYQVHR